MNTDEFISLGHSCVCKHIINTHSLSENSYPLDWLECSNECLLKCIQENFNGFMEDVFINGHNGEKLRLSCKKYKELTSIHDVKCESEIPEFKIKMKRRVERWNNMMNSESDNNFIRLENFLKVDVEFINNLYDVIMKKRTGAFKFFLLTNSENITPEKKEKLNSNIKVHMIPKLEWHHVKTEITLLDFIKTNKNYNG